MGRAAIKQSGAGSLGPARSGLPARQGKLNGPKDSGKERRKTGPCLGWGRPQQWQFSAPISPDSGSPAQPARHGQAVKFSYTSID